MFTGIIEHCGILCKKESGKLFINSPFNDLILGESIAINGVCLTVTAIEGLEFVCNVSPETLRVTTAASFKIGEKLNLERALLPTTRMGGHFVQGHVDQTLIVQEITKNDSFLAMKLSGVTQNNIKYLSHKGSVAVDGVSLTVNQVHKDGFSVMLIPHTLACTNLNNLKEGAQVNLEIDMMARLIIEQCKQYLGVTHDPINID